MDFQSQSDEPWKLALESLCYQELYQIVGP